MIELPIEEMAAAMGGAVLNPPEDGFASRGVIDSRQAGPGDLFFGLPGSNADGSAFAAAALEAGAWGVVVSPQAADELAASGRLIFAVDDPLAALQKLATAWRRTLGARVVGITGSVGKTSVKDIARSLLPGPVHASAENLNTEIGLPLSILEAPVATRTLVLEMAMRGAGQIAELATIAEPDVGVITNIGPVHMEILGSLGAIAAAKAELISGLGPDGVAVVPSRSVESAELEPLLESARVELIRFGAGGDVTAGEPEQVPGGLAAEIAAPGQAARFQFGFTEPYNLVNALAAIAAGVALGEPLAAMRERTASIGFSKLRGERIELAGGILLVNDCYNANPVSMRAALTNLASLQASGRRVAVLGEMAEIGPEAPRFHSEAGELARSLGIDRVIGVGEPAGAYEPDELVADPAEAAELLSSTLGEGDVVLVKGSRSAALESVAEQLEEVIGVG